LSELKTTVRDLQSQGLNLMQYREFEQMIDVFQKAQVHLNEALIRAALQIMPNYEAARHDLKLVEQLKRARQ